jgi:hypothetical protein
MNAKYVENSGTFKIGDIVKCTVEPYTHLTLRVHYIREIRCSLPTYYRLETGKIDSEYRAVEAAEQFFVKV